MTNFQASLTEMFEYALRDCQDSDMVGLNIRNEDNVQDKPIGISFRRKDQISEELIWFVFEKVVQSNARFNALDRLVVLVHRVVMPVGYGRSAVKTKGRQLDVMTHLKKSIIQVKAQENCLAHALIIAIARFDKDSNYDFYRRGFWIIPMVNHLLRTTGIDLTNGEGIGELTRFQKYYTDYRIIVYGGLNCEDIIFDGRNESEKRIHLLYDETTRHYTVITNLKDAKAKPYVCKCCGKGCRSHLSHKCDETFSDCMSTPPCTFSGVRIPCASYNRTFRSQTCFDRHMTNKLRRKTVCAQKRNCSNCGILLSHKKPDCYKTYCRNCMQYEMIGHLCYMKTLANEMPRSDNVLFVLYDFETTQETRITNLVTEHVPNLVCVQHFCSQCESCVDINEDYECCRKRKHSFF